MPADRLLFPLMSDLFRAVAVANHNFCAWILGPRIAS